MIKTKTCVNFTRTETKTSYYKHQVILNYNYVIAIRLWLTQDQFFQHPAGSPGVVMLKCYVSA